MKYVPEKRTGIETYHLWASRIQSAIYWRDSLWNGTNLWRRAYRDYKGIQFNDLVDEGLDTASDNPRDQITINILASQIMTLGPFLVNTNPEYKGTNRKPDGYVSAMIQSSLLNYECRRKGVFNQILKTIYDNLVIGHGVCKTGFIRKVDKAALSSIGDINYEDYITDESVYVKRIRPHDFFFDPNASERTLETARWCAERYYKYKGDVMYNASYNEKVLRKIRSGEYPLVTKDVSYPEEDHSWTTAWSGMGLEALENPESQLVTLWEIWDKKYNKYYVFAEGCPEPLIEADSPYPYLKSEFPYKKVDFVLLPDEWYGVGVHYMIQDQAYELNRHRTFSFHHRRRFSARKYEVLEGVNEDELTKLATGEDGAYIRVKNMNSVKPIDDVPLPKDYVLIEQLIKADIETMTGVDQLIRGGQLPSRTTAGEVGTRVNVFSSKLAHKIKAVDDYYLAIGMQLSAHISANYLREQVIRIVGEQGIYYVQYSNEDLKDEILWDMETISAPKYNPDVDKGQRIQLFGFLVQVLQISAQTGMPISINFNEVFKWVVESFGYKDIARFFLPAAMPVAPPQLPKGQGGDNGIMTSDQFKQQMPAQNAMTAQDLLKQFAGGAIQPGTMGGMMM